MRYAVGLIIAMAGAGGGAPVAAETAPIEVDLELVLAVDVSFSVDRIEARQQRDGYVTALSHPAVVAAATSGPLRRIAVTYVEWSEPGYQRQLVPWRVIDGAETAKAFSEELASQPVSSAYYTSISHAIAYSVGLLDGNGYDAKRRVIDISGDGPQNQGYPVVEARDAAVAAGVVINGLPILNARPNPVGLETPLEAGLDNYYAEYVIGGPGAFIMPAEDFNSFRAAIIAKLVREIAWDGSGEGRSEPAR